MALPEWMTLCIAPFVCTIVCGSVVCLRERRLSKGTMVDIGLALGAILVIGLNKEVLAPHVRNFVTEYIDHFFTCPMCIAAGNLLLVASHRTPWRSFGRCLAVSLGIGLFIEFAYPSLSAHHVGGDWFDVGVYVAGGLATACLYRMVKMHN